MPDILRNSSLQLIPVLTIVAISVFSWVSLPGLVLAGAPGQASASQGKLVQDEAPELFAKRCAHCHGSGVVEPDIQGISKLHSDEIYHTLWNGVMREAANGLDDAQRRAIADFVAGLNPDKPSPPGIRSCAGTGAAAKSSSSVNWNGWAASPDNARYVPDAGISLSQLEQTRLKWAFVIADIAATTNAGNQATIVDGWLFLGSRSKYVHALDAVTGCSYWTFKADAAVRSAIVIYNGRALFADYENNVYALDARTGSLIWRKRADEQPSARVNGNVIVHAGIVYVPISSNQEFVNALDPSLPCCSFRGGMVAYDLTTGRRLWKTMTFDDPLQFLGENSQGTKRYGPSGGAIWSVATVDVKRSLLYAGTSNQYTGPEVEESDAVIALDLATGKRKWVRNFAPEHFAGRDIWHGGCVGVLGDAKEECPEENASGEGDRDIGSPVVLQTRKDGRDVLLVGSKDGMLYALDPDSSGEIIWANRVSQIMKIKGPSFGGIEHGLAADHDFAYVPISDIDVLAGTSAGALVAVDLMNGSIVWRADTDKDSCINKPARCSNSITAPPTVTENFVIVGANDGFIRAYDKKTGRVVWRFDTTVQVTGVNGIEGSGGSISRSGIAIVGNMMYQTSGYGQGLGMPGNVLFAFEIPSD